VTLIPRANSAIRMSIDTSSEQLDRSIGLDRKQFIFRPGE
jgi:hypothetical protein